MSVPEKEEEYCSETGYDFANNNCFDLNAVLSGSRVSQMTKTFADVDAFQKLLEEVSLMFFFARISNHHLHKMRLSVSTQSVKTKVIGFPMKVMMINAVVLWCYHLVSLSNF
jgi:hypothetical protein